MNSNPPKDRCKRRVELVSPASSSSKTLCSFSMHDVLERDNMFRALKRVQSNKGCAGIDGMTVEELPDFLKLAWPGIRGQLIEGDYKPQATKVVHIPKSKGGTRMLGIPTVLDRLIQQALLQTLSPKLDKNFSEFSYGFRCGRNAHQAILKAQEYQRQGHVYTVDIDLEKFFDTVNHDRLMYKLSCKISDKSILRLVRRYLQSGMISGGLFLSRDRGTPQGAPLSPLLSNVVLDELDKELESRGHKFCRYADDCNIYVKTTRSGERVFASITKFIEGKLKLRVNRTKSSVGASCRRNFLGYSFLGQKHPRIRCSNETIARFKHRIKQITRGHRSHQPIRERIQQLNLYINGWFGYFRLSTTSKKFRDLDGWIRSRLRMCMFKQWRRPRTRVRMMLRLGLPIEEAKGYGVGKRYWHLAQIYWTRIAMPNKLWTKLGYQGLEWNMKKFANA